MPGMGVLSHEALAVSSTAVSLVNGDAASYALVTVDSNTIRFRIDGVDPTASTGHALAAGGTLELIDREQVRRFRAIRESADATLRVTYFRAYVA